MRTLRTIAIAATALCGAAVVALAQDMPPPFGGPEDVTFAKKLWTQLEAERFVGENALRATTYEGGTPPHSETLITLQGTVTIDGHTGLAFVKKNFRDGEAAATEEQVFADPDKYLAMYTVMYRREAGFDPDNQNWFWVIYMADGSIRKAPNGMELAGKIAAGMTLEQMPANCIACHKLADGDDYVYLHNSVPN